jgi:predicted double-glycine peptidase
MEKILQEWNEETFHEIYKGYRKYVKTLHADAQVVLASSDHALKKLIHK